MSERSKQEKSASLYNRPLMNYINLNNLNRLCIGDENKRIKYLQQYLELIPVSVIRIHTALEKVDKSALAKEIHHIQPQLMFFGMDKLLLVNFQDETNENLFSRMDKLLEYIKNSILEVEITLQEIKANK